MPDPTPAAPPAPATPPPAAPPVPVQTPPVSPPAQAAASPLPDATRPAETPPAPAVDPQKAGPARGPDGKFLPKEGEKPAEPVKAAEPVADIEIKVPEGAKVDEALLGAFKGVAKEYGLNSKQAQALVEFQVKANAAAEKQYAETMQRQRVADLETVKGDKEFGGAKFDQTVKGARSILAGTKYGPAVSKKLEALGLDCDPDFVRFHAEIRSLIAEDSTATRITNGSGPTVPARPLSQTERQARTYKQQP